MPTVESPHEKFRSALDLVGESWLEKHLRIDETDADKDQVAYEVPIPHDDLPPVVKAYRMAKEDLHEDQTEVIDLPDWRNESLDFLRLGQIYETIKDAPIIDPDGNQLKEVSVKEIFCERLRSESEFESSMYELEVAAAYNEIGHTPAFLKEDETNEKTPDIELIDLNPSVQIECKHCRKQSDEERKQAYRANKLFEEIRTHLPVESHIVILELDETPTKKEVENIRYNLPLSEEIENSPRLDVRVPFGRITILSFPSEEPILYPKYKTNAFDLMNNFYEDLIEPAISNSLEIGKKLDDFGNWVLLFEAIDRKATLLVRNVNFIAIQKSTWGTDIYNRFQNQFTDVSKKFGNKPSILHINFPNLNEGDSLQELKIRQHTGRQLTPRPDISGVVVSGLIYYPNLSEELITRRRIEIPNYQPKHELPDGYRPMDPDSAQSVDMMMKNDVNKELLGDPKGGEKAIAQQEGSLSFRFKPNETRPKQEKKFILDIISEDENNRLILAITPSEKLQLKRLDVETGCWACDLDVSDIPEFDPMHIFITWSPEELGLSVGHQSDDDLRHSRSKTPVDDVEKKDGILQCVDDSFHS
ncbi:hypothetical protein [Haloplanus sp. C73]|uniref:hypothetical protein n=1 Tax=Haloplanus sp. C73 TaxID=3421641 RepID=UPI003EB7B644